MIRRNIKLMVGILIYLSYPLITMKTLGVFACKQLDSGEWWIFEELDIQCWTSQHYLWIVFLGLPNLILWLICK